MIKRLAAPATRAVVLALGAVSLAPLSFAIPICPDTPASLSSLGVGTAGSGINGACVFGAATFTNISLAGSGSSGAAPVGAIDPNQVDISFNQIGNVVNVTLTNGNQANWTLTAQQQFTLQLSYTVTSGDPMFWSFGDSLTGSAGTLGPGATGAISFDKGAFNGSSLEQDLNTLEILGPSGAETLSNSQTAFTGSPTPPLATFNIVDDIQVHASNANATLNQAVNSFVVPEPMTSMLLGSGLLAVGLILRRKRR